MIINKFVAPEIIFGLGALSQIGESALRLGAKKVFVVSDKGVIDAGWVEKALSLLDRVNLEYEVCHEITSNPKDNEVGQCVKLYQKSGCDAVMGVGGGSSIDVAKAVAMLATNDGVIQDFEGVNKITKPLPPMLMVPTTAGSGSEVSQFAIVVDRKRQIKMTIISKSLVPDVAIIDPYTLQTKDARLTATTGIDALSHAIESYVSLAATPLTDVQALNAVRLVANNLRESVACRTNLEAKSAMAMASLQAGLAFSNAILGATHAMTHQVDGLLDSHHGETNAILLPYVMEFNSIACPERFYHIAEAWGEDVTGSTKWKGAQESIKAVRRLVRDIGIDHGLAAIGLQEMLIEKLSKNALNDACIVTNPRDAGKEDIQQLFKKAL